MNMRWLGFICGLMLVLVPLLAALFVFFRLTRKDRAARCRYDERQQLVQGRGFKYGFWAWGCFNFIIIILYTGFDIQFMDMPMTLFGGLLTGMLFYASYCIWHEGYFAVNVYPKRMAALFLAVMGLNLICAARFVRHGLFEGGMLSFRYAANLLCAVEFLLIFIVMLLKYYSLKRKTEDA